MIAPNPRYQAWIVLPVLGPTSPAPLAGTGYTFELASTGGFREGGIPGRGGGGVAQTKTEKSGTG